MKLNERYFHVKRAVATLRAQLETIQEALDLTDIEMMQALNEWQAMRLKYMLRYERHGDYEKEADRDFGDAVEGNTCFDREFD